MDAISAAGYEPGKQIGICLDVASSEFYNKETGKYALDGEERDSAYMLDYYENLINEYPIVSIEDPFNEEGWEDWAAITARLGDRLQFVGDDLLVTNPARLQKAIDLGAANSPAGQAEPDRFRHRDPRRHRAGHRQRLHIHGFPPLRRDPGHHHLRPGCC